MMLVSELDERGRHFSLALRAGIPLLMLIFLVMYSIFSQDTVFPMNLTNKFLIAAVVFITVYFIYFLMELSATESLVDQTTQVFNRKAFIDRLEQKKPKAISLLIVDNLYIINENYSIEEVDLLLYNIVHHLNMKFSQNNLENAMIARLYGAEFIIALDKSNDHIDSIMKAFADENKSINGIEIDLKFAIVTNTNIGFKKLISQLKDLINIQKKNPNKSQLEIIKDANEVSRIEDDIKYAISNEKLVLSFRPLQRAKSDVVDIYEISTKLKSMKSGKILPRVYLPVVNRLGLGREYDFILFRHIVDLLPLVDKNISFSFNLSPFSLRDTVFQEKVFDYIRENGADTSRLIIELYESKTHHNLSGYLKTLNSFRAKGIKIAIDNFGSSNASMEYMKHFSFDLVQFDRDYVSKLDDANTHSMLESMIRMSKDMNIITVAKWVDSHEQKLRLEALGIDYLQGFGIAKPITEKTLIDIYN